VVDLKKHVGLRVKAARQTLGLTQEDLAEAVGKAVETISHIERGHSLASVETLQYISKQLKVPLTDFFDGLDKARPAHRRRMELEQKLGRLLESMPDEDVELALAMIEVLARHGSR
jgi:transcriptional regulator with XRE-family HTH domain